MEDKIRVLHDFDSPFLSGTYALRRGLRLIMFALSKKLPFLRPFVKDIYAECYSYCLTLARLDKLMGLKSTFGLKQEVEKEFPDLRCVLEEMGFDVRRHVHISKAEVTWDPPLDVEPKYWFFDQAYATGRMKPSRDTKWAVFHADYPYLLDWYVRFLNEVVPGGLVKTSQRLS
jgi:hypothetical protein